MAKDVLKVSRDIVKERVLEGGWSWSGHVGPAYMFHEIPYDVIFNTAFDAMQGAVDWITNENGATWQLVDTLGREIAIFTLWPTNADLHKAPINLHEEL